jgi:mRNA-degrading endonuclease RelE of RelBE toxin-antitoxin system
MQFLIADSFTDSLSRLNGDEQKAVKTTAFDLQVNPANPGMSFHRLDKARDKNFWSVRASSDIRIIVHKTSGSLLLCYVDHHDDAYSWAERRKLETHPTTGAAQIVEIRETVKEIVIPSYIQSEEPEKAPAPPLFRAESDESLLKYGVPPEWLDDVRALTDEDALLTLAERLPTEAAEALLELATGGKPAIPEAAKETSPFEHPDAKRRFRIVQNADELQQALDYPWEKWTVFLHPGQREWVERNYNGPARITGSAGTGKTVVALHRAAHLARTKPEARIFLATFSETLASALKTKLRRLLGAEPRLAERIDVHSMTSLGLRLHKTLLGPAKILPAAEVNARLQKAASGFPAQFTPNFLRTEWEQVVDAWQIESWEGYRDVARLGRKTRLPEARRQALWQIFAALREELAAENLVTESAVFTRLAEYIAQAPQPPFEHAIIDEAQDLSVAQLRFFAALGGNRPTALFFAGDVGQRIFQQPFSWKALGVDIRGRSRTLRVNYRTSHQIRSHADRLLGPEITDADGNVEARNHTISAFNGVPPEISMHADMEDEERHITEWIQSHLAAGALPHEIGIFVRSTNEIPRAQRAVQKANTPSNVLDDHIETTNGHVSIGTMHLAKGLEFRCVAVMACDEEILPLQERIAAVGDNADLQEIHDTERHLLYVACTRARDHLLITGLEPGSEFLDDLHP